MFKISLKPRSLLFLSLGLAAALVIAAPLTLSARADAPSSHGVAIGTAVAPFSLPTADGTPTMVGNWSASKATVLIFVSTQCPVSNAYNDRMEKLATSFAPKGVQFYGINANRTEDAAEVAQYAKAHGFTFPTLKDTSDTLANRLNAHVTPEAYVIDGSGKLVYHGRVDDNIDTSKVTQSDLDAALTQVVAGAAVTHPSERAFGCSIKR